MPSCTEPVYTELADDDASPLGVTADDLLAIATPGWEGVGLDVDDAAVDIAWAVERGEGSAVFADIEETTVVLRRQFGFGPDVHFGLHVVCDDWLEVPANLSIVSEAAGIDHEMDGALLSSQPVEEERVAILATEPYEDSGIVVPGIDESFDTQTIDARLSMEAEGRSAGSLSWNGIDDTHGRTIYILSWDDDEEAE
jgi:hypothetical protein